MYFLAFVGCGWFLCCLEMPFEISFRGRCVVQRFGAREGMDVKHISGGVHLRLEEIRGGKIQGPQKRSHERITKDLQVLYTRWYDGVTCTVVRVNLSLLLARGI